jgi:putative ribosome biogenesis GTPase RsgA
LINAGIAKDQIDRKLIAIKQQKITNIFFLPKGSGLDDDYIALLSDVHTVPYSVFAEKKSKAKQFTLSQIGFYIFVLKLSVHFCRFHENVDRQPV